MSVTKSEKVRDYSAQLDATLAEVVCTVTVGRSADKILENNRCDGN
ncbi:MAG: hypothetical protein AAF298_14050 [Cyanobacteria bacterium P01_A01_bin.40]